MFDLIHWIITGTCLWCGVVEGLASLHDATVNLVISALRFLGF